MYINTICCRYFLQPISLTFAIFSPFLVRYSFIHNSSFCVIIRLLLVFRVQTQTVYLCDCMQLFIICSNLLILFVASLEWIGFLSFCACIIYYFIDPNTFCSYVSCCVIFTNSPPQLVSTVCSCFFDNEHVVVQCSSCVVAMLLDYILLVVSYILLFVLLASTIFCVVSLSCLYDCCCLVLFFVSISFSILLSCLWISFIWGAGEYCSGRRTLNIITCFVFAICHVLLFEC